MDNQMSNQEIKRFGTALCAVFGILILIGCISHAIKSQTEKEEFENFQRTQYNAEILMNQIEIQVQTRQIEMLQRKVINLEAQQIGPYEQFRLHQIIYGPIK